MLKNKHLDNKLIIDYVNNKKLTISKIKNIEKHLFNDKCKTCKEKYSDLKNFNTLINSDLIFEEENSKTEICEYSEKLDKFLSNDMTEFDKSEFKKHLIICDDCRNILSILVKNNPKLLKRNTLNEDNLWINLKEDKYQIKNYLKNFLTGSFKTQFVSPSIAYRGLENQSKEYQEIELPEGNGKVSFTLSPNNDTFNLEIKILNPLNHNRIDIFTNSNMLNSIDGDYLSFQIPDEEFKILINDKFEIC